MSIALQRVTPLRRRAPLLRHINCVMSYRTAGAKARPIIRARGAWGEACRVPLPCFSFFCVGVFLILVLYLVIVYLNFLLIVVVICFNN